MRMCIMRNYKVVASSKLVFYCVSGCHCTLWTRPGHNYRLLQFTAIPFTAGGPCHQERQPPGGRLGPSEELEVFKNKQLILQGFSRIKKIPYQAPPTQLGP